MDGFMRRNNNQDSIWLHGLILLTLLHQSWATFMLEKETISLSRESNPQTRNEKKVVLFWTQYFETDVFAQLYENLSHCPEQRCLATNNRTLLSQSSAVIFNSRDMYTWDIPPEREPHQQYVFYSVESPYLSYIDLRKKPWLNFFNLTWTYRTDSDVVSSVYFYPHDYRLRLWTNRTAQREILGKRMNRAMALISNCGAISNRDDYIKQLQQYFPVDVFGRCGDSRRRSCTDCEEKIISYKFYLAFENGFCKDYLTEKVTRTYRKEVLPVVLGAGNYSGIFPPHSLIDTADFETPRQLASHLWKLSRKPHLYEEYFEWKYEERYLAIPEMYNPNNTDMCKLCEILHDEGRLEKSSSYEMLDEWWTTASHCFVPAFSYPGIPGTSNAVTVVAVLLGLVLFFNLIYLGYRYRHRCRYQFCERKAEF